MEGERGRGRVRLTSEKLWGSAVSSPEANVFQHLMPHSLGLHDNKI